MSIDILLNPTSTFFSDASEVSIAVKCLGNNNFHCGLIYKNPEDGIAKFLHLAWHYDLRSEEIPAGYHWVVPKLHPTRQTIASAYFAHLYDRTKEHPIKYGLMYNGKTQFTPTYEYIVGDDCSGLTCATFVLAAYKAVGVTLVDLLAWEERPSDQEWHEYIIDMLTKYGAESEHISRVKLEKGCARFRPSEVTASLTFDPQPADSLLIQERGAKFEVKLKDIT